MLAGLQKIPIKALRHRDWWKSEMRVQLSPPRLKYLSELVESGVVLDPPKALFGPDEIVRLKDGFHRVEIAYQRHVAGVGPASIEVDLRPGTLIDAIVGNIEANREHRGEPFGPGDRKKAVITILQTPELAHLTRKEVGALVGVTSKYVSELSREIEQREARSAPGPIGETAQKVVALLFEGKTSKQICETLGLAKSSVSWHVEQARRFGALHKCATCGGSGYVRAPIPKEQSHGG